MTPDLDIRLLAVEDDEAVRQFIEVSLRPNVVSLDHAGTLKDALELLLLGRFNCILLDLNLPDSKGVDTVRVIQQAHPETPIVVFTGDEKPWREALMAGAETVVFKPVNAGDLVRAIRHAVVRHAVRRKYEPYQQALASAIDKVDDQLKEE